MTSKPTQAGPAVPGAVWLREPRPARHAPALTRERIVTAAVAVLDGSGEAGLSMRRLAETLDVHATSLYWHVANRDELLDLALDAVFGEIDLPAAHAAAWRDDVAAFMGGLRAALLAHPWSAALAGSRPLIGPNALARSEFVYTALAGAGFDGPDLSAAAAAVSHHVIAAAATETAWRHGDPATARRALNDHLRRSAAHYPTLAAHAPSLRNDWEDHFDRAAAFLLDGLAAHGGHT
ncbi:TetR family transcriptional regulator [Murinocardiopsis flavida]|uniref:TetR family transcriptional regulator n=1 Tax=Murinocardiopsis flavida TaxID=645275 RepID=A0A2P8DH54_9ACTN|nr:TetR/AcrR family transcriptional regulator C-terminal domain-containing protein [Murinocardiopsis flavida]PSK96543.1 TetR family transcriptional regulator [Murinocardiopsis flavida]